MLPYEIVYIILNADNNNFTNVIYVQNTMEVILATWECNMLEFSLIIELDVLTL